MGIPPAELGRADLVAQNTADYDLLLEGVTHMWNLEMQVVEAGSMDAIKTHYDQHPEDRLCHIYHPSDNRMVLCRREGLLAIGKIARRLIRTATNPADFSVTGVSDVISRHILPIVIDGVTDDEELTDRLLSYVGIAEANHVERRYHFACILAHAESPTHFRLGAVTFTRSAKFILDLNEQRGKNQLEFDESIVPKFAEHTEQHGWVASVQIPKSAPDVSRRRAENTVELALGLLKVFIGLGYSKGMRLPHVAPAYSTETYVLIQNHQKITWNWHGRSLQSALVEDDWFAHIPEDFRRSAAHLITASTFGVRSEIAERIIDAVRWFSDASFEATAGVQIAKWIAALERLTTLAANFKAHVFCKRVALLASEDQRPTSMAKAYRTSRAAYKLRCDVMHGSASQDDERFREQAATVHDLTRFALMRALEVHCLLDDAGKLSKKKQLIRFFVKAELPFTELFIDLGYQYDKSSQHSDAADRPEPMSLA